MRQALDKVTALLLLTGLTVLAVGGGTAWASPTAGMSPGRSLTLGSGSHPHAIGTGFNPAATPLGPAFSTSIIRLGVGYEIGPVGELIDDLEDLQDELERDDFASLNDAEQVKEEFDDFLKQAGRDGYVKLTGFGNVPLTPVSLRLPWGNGGLSLDVRYTAQARLGILDAPIEAYSEAGEFKVRSDTALYVKGAVIREITAGYGHTMLSGESGKLLVGLSFTHYQSELSKVVIPLQDAEDIADTVSDEYDANRLQDTAVGAGLGLLWSGTNLRFGMTGRNLNQPDLQYAALGYGCGRLSGGDQERCMAAQGFGNRIDLEETWTLEPQLTFEGALYTESRDWALSFSYDSRVIQDPVGEEQQWFAVGLSTRPNGFLLPEWRFGYRENLAGSALSYVTTGFTLFGSFSLDLAYGLESVSIGGIEEDEAPEEYPRSVMINVGIDLAF